MSASAILIRPFNEIMFQFYHDLSFHSRIIMEETVKQMIRESLEKRIYGLDRIDNILTNDVLISRWLTCIMALGYNQNEIEAAAQDIFEMQAYFSNNSIEDVRARVCQSQVRFGEEIAAFMRYVEMRDSESDAAIERAVAEELELVEEGDILF